MSETGIIIVKRKSQKIDVKDLYINKEKVMRALRWLIWKNDLYENIIINEENERESTGRTYLNS